ncbi:MAG: Mu-like prophage major head subunit gpT family protein [Phycisphaeraceae bacterium]|nr:Mu-like prophage major head subunit gpT family protein [Phycisphaeraceae bacterium]
MNTTIHNDIILASTEVTIEAAERKQPTVSVLAYSGAIMRITGWGPLAVDLSGIQAGDTIPLLVDHDSTLGGIVGHGTPAVRDGKLFVTGSIAEATDAARKVIELARGGFRFGASVGLEPVEHVRVGGGEKISVNGQNITAPAGGMVLVKRGVLREVSITAVAADRNTAVSIAASKGAIDGGEDDVLAAERTRVSAIMKLTTKNPEIAAKAVSEGWDATKTELEVLRASRPKPPFVNTYAPVASAEVIEAAFAFRMGLGQVAEKHLKPDVLEQAHRLGITHSLDLCRMALVAEGMDVPNNREAMVKAALSTMSLPTALGDLANKNLLDAYAEAPATWRSFAAIRSVADFKTNTTIRPSFTGGLEQVAPGGELKHGRVGEWTASYKIDTYGKLLGIDRRDLINDDLGVFAEASAAMGKAAMRKLNDLVFSVLLANANNFFGAGNGNYISGVDSALNFDSLANAIKAMLGQKDEEGNDLDLRPAVLLVPPALETLARALLESEYIQAAVNLPTGNSLRNVVKLEVEPRLANTTKFGNLASNAHWYLFAPPAATVMVVAFLNGQQNPTIEYQGLEANINTLAAHWRVYHDFGSALVDPRAGVRSKGTA